jgi:hypothetical protein
VGRKTDLKPTFDVWRKQLMEAMYQLSDSIGPQFKGGPMVDNRIPYDWGWTPKRAAAAYLALTYTDYVALGDSAIGPEKGALPHRDLVHRRCSDG